MVNPTYDQLEILAKKKGYVWFTDAYDLNVIGIRNSNRITDAFDDTLAIAYKDKGGNKRVFLAPFTVDPGVHYTKNPMSKEGCAILPEGQYLGLWILGKHKGYVALSQRKPIKVMRDSNKNLVGDGVLSTILEIIGLDLHRCLEDNIVLTVGKFSAGCQVVQVPEDFFYVLGLVKLQVKYVKSAIVSYTLISERDLNTI